MHVYLKMGDSDGRKYTHLKMGHTTWLSLLVALVTFITPALSGSPRVVCYYTNWSVYRPGTAKFNPQNINPYLCTHLVYAFGGFTKDNTLKPFDKYQDIEKGGYAKFTGLKTYNKNLKTILAIGGWNEGSTRFSPMVAAKDRRREFVRNVIKFLRQNHFDGLDLDWEYPAFRDGGKAKDRENYAKLVKELREEFEKESEKTGKPRLLLTMAVPAGIEYIEKGFDVKTLNRYLDWMNLLTYDYHSAFEPAVNHHAPLYPLEEPNEYSVDNELNIDYTIRFYLENGADRDKLVLGIPTYGRSYTLFNPDAVEIGAPADGPGEQGDATREKGYLAYYEICEALKPKTNKKRAIASDEYEEEDSDEDESEEEEEEWTIMYPNRAAMGPVAYKGNQWVGYDDVDIVKKKAEYVAENGLGGIMFWSIDNDDFRGTCHGKPYPLIEAAKEAYIAKIGSTDNAVVKQTPKVSSKSGSRRRNRPKTSTTITTTTTTTTTKKPKIKSNKRKSGSTTSASTTPSWNIITPEPPTTPDPGSDFKCTEEGFFQHPRDCKKYFWCLDSGPSDLGIVAHQFTCPSGLYFNKAADSCDFARNVLCKKTAATTKAPPKPTTAKTTVSTTTTTTTTRRPIRLTSRNSLLFRTSTTTTTPEPEVSEEESLEEVGDEASDVEAEDPKVIKELIDLIKKVGGVEQLEKHLKFSETSGTTDGVATTTPSAFNKKLYQRVLERARGRNKFGGNSITESSVQNSRRGPQNAGLEPAPDKDRLLRKERPQYVTINRSRPSTSTTLDPIESEEVEEESEEIQQFTRVRDEPVVSIGTTAKPLQYVNIRRSKPTTVATTETPDDSRNALFERVEPYVSVAESPNSLDIASARRENVPEYVTIRRSRPTTAETTTIQYQVSEQEEESQESVLEREITSQSSLPLYTSVLRARSTTLPPPEEPNTPEPTTILSVQLSSLLNVPSSEETEQREQTQRTVTQTTELPELETTTTSTTAITTPTPTTTSTSASSSTPTRRTLLRRRGSTAPTTSTAAPVSTTQVSSRNYSFIRRRRPLSQPNEILSESNDSEEIVRKIRSTTPDSREVEGIKPVVNRVQIKRFRGRFQPSRNEDSISAAASQPSRGQLRPQLNQNVLLSLTPVDVETSEIIENEEVSENGGKFLGRASTTLADKIEDSEVSAATIDERRTNALSRGRGKFAVSTTEAISNSVATEPPLSLRRPTFARFTPRPFGRTVSTTESEIDENVSLIPRTRPRLTFTRQRATISTAAPLLQARKLPFTSQQSTTRQTLASQNDEDEIDNKNDDISLSESAIEEKEHDEILNNGEDKKTNIPETITESIPVVDSKQDKNAKRKFRVIRRRPTTPTVVSEISNADVVEATTTAIPRIRKIIRKKLKPVEQEPEITTKVLGFVNAGFKDAPKDIINYGEKTRLTVTSTVPVDEPKITSENEDLGLELVTEILKEPAVTKLDKKEDQEGNVSPVEVELPTLSKDITKASHEEKFDVLIETPNTDQEKPNIIVEADDKIQDSPEKRDKDVETTESNQTEYKNEINNQETVTEHLELHEENKNITLQNKDSTKDEESLKNKNTDDAFGELSTTEISPTETETTIQTTTTSTTQLTSPSPRSRSPYRPPKRLFTSTTESAPSSSRTFSRKYNPGAYTSPATVERPGSFSRGTTRRPLFSRTFTRRTYPTARTTPKYQDEDEEEYSDEELLDEEPESPFAFVPQSQLFTRKPDSEEYEDNDEEEPTNEDLEEAPEDDNYEEDQSAQFKPTSKKPLFRPKIVNSNTFRTSTSTTELPRRLFGSNQNRTAIYNRFGGNKPVNDTKKRVQNVPPGYSSPKSITINLNDSTSQIKTPEDQENESSNDNDLTTTESDDYLTMPEVTTFASSELSNNSKNFPATIESESSTVQMEIDNSTDDYLQDTTYYPSTQDVSTNEQTNTESEMETSNDVPTTRKIEIVSETATEILPETTTNISQMSPIVKTQFDKLFSVSRVVEVSSKSEKRRLNKNNETTLIEEGQVMIEKKPTVDKIGEVSRYSLIKIVEEEIPIYLTKLGHVYPVDNPPDNPIRIDEARNARALVDFSDIPKENLVASESMNEAYRHINKVSDKTKHTEKNQVEHIFDDDFLSYVNEDKREDKSDEDLPYDSHWQFVPAAYDNEKNKQNNEAKSFEIVTPRLMLTDPSTLPLEALFKTENPIKPRKVSDAENNKPFVVYSAPVPTQEEDASLVKLKILKPQYGRSIVTFAKGKEFKGEPTIDDSSVIYPISISIIEQSTGTTAASTSTSTTTTTTPSLKISTTPAPTSTSISIENSKTSPIVELLTTTQSTTLRAESIQTTEQPTQTTPVTTETIPDETTTVKISPLNAKRAKFGFPRKPVIRPLNITRLNSVPRTPKKLNATAVPNLIQKTNKTSTFSPNKTRALSNNRVQNVPVDIRKKLSTPKLTRTFTTESPRSTTERKVVIKPIRTNIRPAFVPKRFTTVATTFIGDT